MEQRHIIASLKIIGRPLPPVGRLTGAGIPLFPRKSGNATSLYYRAVMFQVKAVFRK
jgi:hypothetical protein